MTASRVVSFATGFCWLEVAKRQISSLGYFFYVMAGDLPQQCAQGLPSWLRREIFLPLSDIIVLDGTVILGRAFVGVSGFSVAFAVGTVSSGGRVATSAA